MYRNILVPLDRSVESEGILDVIPQLVDSEGQTTLLAVIPPGRTRSMGELVVLGTQQEEEERSRAMYYLNRIASPLRDSSINASAAVVVHQSVAEAIVAYAERNDVDLISMFTHDRRGLAKLVKGSVSKEVERRARIPVRIFRPEDLAERQSLAVAGQADAGTVDYSSVDLFARLSADQIARIVALGREVNIEEGRSLGEGNEAGQSLYVIISGEAHLTAHAEVGEIAVRLAGPGESFPLAALLGEGALITSGRALSDMTVLQVPRSTFLDLCAHDNALGMGVYANAAQLFANRYSSTLTQLGISAAREMRDMDAEPYQAT
jgi:CRP-like cAMP-binding protein/nucleotide-binding universal stress UspA family protein